MKRASSLSVLSEQGENKEVCDFLHIVVMLEVILLPTVVHIQSHLFHCLELLICCKIFCLQVCLYGFSSLKSIYRSLLLYVVEQSAQSTYPDHLFLLPLDKSSPPPLHYCWLQSWPCNAHFVEFCLTSVMIQVLM